MRIRKSNWQLANSNSFELIALLPFVKGYFPFSNDGTLLLEDIWFIILCYHLISQALVIFIALVKQKNVKRNLNSSVRKKWRIGVLI